MWNQNFNGVFTCIFDKVRKPCLQEHPAVRLSGLNLTTSTACWTTWPVMREQRPGSNAWCVGVMKIKPSRPIFNTPLKVTQIDVYTQTSGKIFEKIKKTGMFTYFEARIGPKIGPLSPIFSTHKSTCKWACEAIIIDVKPVRTFCGSDFLLTLGLKMVQKLGLWSPDCTPLKASPKSI